MVKRLAAAILGLTVVLSFWAPAARAQAASPAGTMVLSGGGGLVGSQSSAPPSGAITAAQAEAAVTKYFTPPEGATVNANYTPGFLPNERPNWNISWFVVSSGPMSGEAEEGMFASVDAMTGRILYFNRQSPAGTASGPSAVTCSYQQALARARQVMAELAPEAVGRVELETTTPGSYAPLANYDYQFNFIRQANGLPVWQSGRPQGVDIGMNARTGEVDSYTYNWLTGVSFPSPTPALDVTKATYDWWNKGGLELQYNFILPGSPASRFGGSNNARLAYVLKDGGLYVDAGSGKLVDDSGQPCQAESGPIPAPTVPLRSLPPGGLASSTAALSWARQVLPVPNGYKVANVGQGEAPGPTGQTRQMWSLSWSNGQGPYGVSAGFLADSGKLVNYNVFPEPAPGAGNAPAVSRSQALQTAVDFLTGTAGINLPAGYRLENLPVYLKYGEIKGGDYSFTFTPTPNGIPFDMGDVYVTVSSASGQVIGFNQLVFQPANLPSPQGIMGMDQARDIFNKNITLQLGYLIPVPAEASASQASSSVSAVLVYGVPARFAGAVIDAVTGEITDREGNNLLLGSGPPADVAGSWAAGNIEQVLQRHLMTVDAQGLFHPQDPVTRGEAVEMLLQALGYGFQTFPAGPVDFADVPVGSPYYGAVEIACHMGMVAKADSFRPNDPVTREDFAVMAIRALKYDAVGRMALRIPLPYLDAGLVNPAEANYVALAAGLGIFHSGGDFRPTDPLTRAEAATVLVRMPSPR